jgi:hypothetical protein
MFASALAAVLAIASGVLLIGFLIRVVLLMRHLSGSLTSVNLVLRAVAVQTEPVGGFVDGIGENVASIEVAIRDLITLVESPAARAAHRAPDDAAPDYAAPDYAPTSGQA